MIDLDCDLLVVSVMEGAVGDAEEGSDFGVVRVLSVALQQGQGRNEVSLFQKVVRIWQLQLILLNTISKRVRI